MLPLCFAEHPWLQNAKKAPNVPLGDVVKSRLKQFSMMNRFKRKALRVKFIDISFLTVDGIFHFWDEQTFSNSLFIMTGHCRSFVN